MIMVERKDLIEEDMLKLWLSADVDVLFEAFKKYGRFLDDPYKRHLFFDNGAKVLAVCHLDTVQDPLPSSKINVTEQKITATGLGDRLGGYILSRLNSWGFECDLLMCDLEESGMSSGQYFETEKEYDWVVEFDRQGCDIAHYGEINAPFKKFIKNIGGGLNYGSFTDLCYLELPNDPVMFNMGIGYYEAHGKNSYAIVDELYYNMLRFSLIYEKFHGTPLKADEAAVVYSTGRRSNSWNGYGSGHGVGSKVQTPKKKATTTKVTIADSCNKCEYYGGGGARGICFLPDGSGRTVQDCKTETCNKWSPKVVIDENKIKLKKKEEEIEEGDKEKKVGEEKWTLITDLTADAIEDLVPWKEDAILTSYLDGETACPQCKTVHTTDAVWFEGYRCPKCYHGVVNPIQVGEDDETLEGDERCTNCIYLFRNDDTVTIDNGIEEPLYECGLLDQRVMRGEQARNHCCDEWSCLPSHYPSEVR